MIFCLYIPMHIQRMILLTIPVAKIQQVLYSKNVEWQIHSISLVTVQTIVKTDEI